MSAKKKNTTSDSLSVSIKRSALDENGIEMLKAVIKSKEGLFRKAFGSDKLIQIFGKSSLCPLFLTSTQSQISKTKYHESVK